MLLLPRPSVIYMTKVMFLQAFCARGRGELRGRCCNGEKIRTSFWLDQSWHALLWQGEHYNAIVNFYKPMLTGFYHILFFPESARCCNPAPSSQCRAVCKAIFIENALPSRSQREAVAEYCDMQVATCVHNYTKTTPSQNPAESKSQLCLVHRGLGCNHFSK